MEYHTELHGFVHRFLPGAPGMPTLLLLHGTGGDENDLVEVGGLVLPGASLLLPRGKVLENGMSRFFRRFAEGVFDLEDVRLRAEELAGFVKAATATYGREHEKLIAVGYSNGANMAGALLLLYPQALSAAVLFHAMVTIAPEPPPALGGKRVLLTGGRQDPLIPPEETERLGALLRSAGAAVDLIWQPGGHRLSRPEIEAARDWMRGLDTED